MDIIVFVNTSKSKLDGYSLNQIIKPAWRNGIDPWGCISKAYIRCIKTQQIDITRGIVNVLWFERNEDIYNDLKTETLMSAIK